MDQKQSNKESNNGSAAITEDRNKGDLFKDVLDIEQSMIQEGEREAIKDGTLQGTVEGRQMGWNYGVKFGKEMGMYFGSTLIWAHQLEIDSNCYSARAAASIVKLQNMISELSLIATNENIHQSVEEIRAQYKLTCAQIGITLNKDKKDKLAF